MPPEDIRVCFLGDSYVLGVGDEENLGWVGRVCAATRSRGVDLTGYNLGIRGETTRQLLRRCEGEIGLRLAGPWRKAVVFSFGVNDTRQEESGHQPISHGESLDNTRQILRRVQRETTVLMVGPPPVPDAFRDHRVAALSAGYGEVCRSLDIPFLDVHTPLSQAPSWLREAREDDGFHPRRFGYGEFAGIVCGWTAWRQLTGGSRM
ncbi:GDSL-type esterase/lipase family protein [Telmatospirillum sp. J64-1]|uniref:GDSL-type esterase/lipase family protein n=1 Tax=Telmatospirillum sp. J64-1 TaxID=2502183 RepID=UPI00163D8050|nr:GDSL-type esterase/lipase family protein [Telmatospirillum sp. J64-1]